MRGDDACRSRRALLVSAPAHSAGVALVLLGPHGAQEHDRLEAGEVGGGRGIVESVEEFVAVAPDVLGERGALGLAFGQPVGVGALLVAREPVRVDRVGAGQPGGSGHRQRLKGAAHGLGDELQPVQVTDAGDDVGGVGAGPAAGPQQALLVALREDGVQDLLFQAVGDQPVAELAEHREIKARIGQLEAEGVFPVDPATHRISGLPVGQTLCVLQHADQRQHPRRHRRTAPMRERRHEPLAFKHHPELVPDPHGQTPARKRSTGDPRRGLRHRRRRQRTHRHDIPLGPRKQTRQRAVSNAPEGHFT
nr:hypothetical protein OG546_36075 [Streptomyces antimycoticus]